MTVLAYQPRQITLAALLHSVLPEHVLAARFEGIVVRGLSQDSRRIRAGDLFLALRGVRHDATAYIDGAIADGAVAVLSDCGDEVQPGLRWLDAVPIIPVYRLRQKVGRIAAHFFGEPSRRVPVIGVTGTNGKTSFTQYVAQILHGLGQCCGVIGTLGSGVYPDLKDTGYTTPDAIAVQSNLADLVESHAHCVAMEVSSQGLDQFRVGGVDFYSGVFTNLTRDHLDYHGSMAAYVEAKQKLFCHQQMAVAIINADDPWHGDMAGVLSAGVRSITYGVAAAEADVRASQVSLNADGFEATVQSPWGAAQIKTSLMGDFNVSNVLAALSAVMTLPQQYSFEDVVAQVEALQPVPGRMQRVSSAADVTVVVDYAHTPDGLNKALQAMRSHTGGQLWCLFGCGGERDRGKRPLMAQVAEQGADYVVVADDNPRYEDGDQIIADIRAGFSPVSQVTVMRDRAAAIEHVITHARAGDAVLIAGKGHEMYQEVAGRRYEFDDVSHAAEALTLRSTVQGQGGAL